MGSSNYWALFCTVCTLALSNAFLQLINLFDNKKFWKNLGNAENQTQTGRAWSANATSVQCYPLVQVAYPRVPWAVRQSLTGTLLGAWGELRSRSVESLSPEIIFARKSGKESSLGYHGCWIMNKTPQQWSDNHFNFEHKGGSYGDETK